MYQNLYEQRFLELQFFSYVSGIGVRPVTPVVCVYWLDCERILGDALSHVDAIYFLAFSICRILSEIVYPFSFRALNSLISYFVK